MKAMKFWLLIAVMVVELHTLARMTTQKCVMFASL